MVVGVPIYFIPLQTLQSVWLDNHPVFVPVPFSAPGGGALNLTSPESFSLHAIFKQLLYLVFAFVANFGLAIAFLGSVLSLVGLGAAFRTETGVVLRVLASVIVGTVAAGSVGVLLYVSKLFRALVINTVSFVTTFGLVLVLLTAGLLWLEQEIEGSVRIVVLSPLASGAVFFAAIAGALSTPELQHFFTTIADGVVRFLLLKVFSIGNLNVALSQLFELQGIGYYLFYGVVNLLVGWMLGAVAYALDLSPAEYLKYRY